jgi:TPP-dependent pyruvate/acetoin dehydrogenase alpha subunit
MRQVNTSLTERLLDDFRMICRIRCFEDKVMDLCRSGNIAGSVHLGSGQEGVAVGACSVLEPRDALFATYRGHAWVLARGADLELVFAELLGRRGGVNVGRGGSAYLSVPEVGFYGENSIVGAGAPHAVGAALAARYDRSGRVGVSVFGDGATNQGAVLESLNFAAAFKLPVIFICENNKYSELTPYVTMVGNPAIHERAASFGMAACRVDGNDTELMREAVREALNRARTGKGPSFIEAMTQRIVGHYQADPEVYRPKGEVDELMKVEPLGAIVQRLLAASVPEAEVERLQKSTAAEIEAAAQAALAQPLSDTSNIREHLYA